MLVPQEGNATFWFIRPFKWFYVIFPWAKIFSKLVLCVQSFTLSHSKIKTLWSHWHAPSYCFHPREMSSYDDVSLFTDAPVAACLQLRSVSREDKPWMLLYLRRTGHGRWPQKDSLGRRYRKWVGHGSRRTSYASLRNVPH